MSRAMQDLYVNVRLILCHAPTCHHAAPCLAAPALHSPPHIVLPLTPWDYGNIMPHLYI